MLSVKLKWLGHAIVDVGDDAGGSAKSEKRELLPLHG